MTASGTSGHGAELSDYGDLGELGAVVVKSLSVEPVAGQPRAPGARGRRRHAQQRRPAGPRAGGLGGRRPPGASPTSGARVVVSIWGRSVADYATAAELVARWPPRRRRVVHRGARGQRQLSQRRGPLADVRPLGRGHGAGARRPRHAGCPGGPSSAPTCPTWWRSPRGAVAGGADGLTLVNTLLGPGARHRDGPARARRRWRRAVGRPGAPRGRAGRVGVPGRLPRRCPSSAWVASPPGRDAVELLMAGADAVQVGTATFRDPKAPWKVLRQLARWCDDHGTTVAGSVSVPLAAPAAHDARPPGRPGRRSRHEKGGTMADSFRERVTAAVARTGPLCAGIDPSAPCWRIGACRRRRRVCAPSARPASRGSPGR